MNPKPVQFFIAIGAACFLAGILAMQIFTGVTRSMQTVPTGMIGLEVLEHCRNSEGKKWTLLQTYDGQRCYTYEYRGQVGDQFFVWPEDLRGYKSPNVALDLTMTSAQIELTRPVKKESLEDKE